MKAILVIDVPTSCTMCKADKICKVWNEEQVKFKGFNDRLDGCPLKPIHALKSGGKDYIIYERQYLYGNLEREYELMKEARDFDEKCKSIVKEELIKRMEHPERYAKR